MGVCLCTQTSVCTLLPKQLTEGLSQRHICMQYVKVCVHAYKRPYVCAHHGIPFKLPRWQRVCMRVSFLSLRSWGENNFLNARTRGHTRAPTVYFSRRVPPPRLCVWRRTFGILSKPGKHVDFSLAHGTNGVNELVWGGVVIFHTTQICLLLQAGMKTFLTSTGRLRYSLPAGRG